MAHSANRSGFSRSWSTIKAPRYIIANFSSFIFNASYSSSWTGYSKWIPSLTKCHGGRSSGKKGVNWSSFIKVRDTIRNYLPQLIEPLFESLRRINIITKTLGCRLPLLRRPLFYARQLENPRMAAGQLVNGKFRNRDTHSAVFPRRHFNSPSRPSMVTFVALPATGAQAQVLCPAISRISHTPHRLSMCNTHFPLGNNRHPFVP